MVQCSFSSCSIRKALTRFAYCSVFTNHLWKKLWIGTHHLNVWKKGWTVKRNFVTRWLFDILLECKVNDAQMWNFVPFSNEGRSMWFQLVLLKVRKERNFAIVVRHFSACKHQISLFLYDFSFGLEARWRTTFLDWSLSCWKDAKTESITLACKKHVTKPPTNITWNF